MNEQDAFKLLTLASLRDNRTVTRAHAQAWAADLADIAYVEAEGAVSAHYAESTAWLMPKHVRDHALAVRAARARRARESRRQIERAAVDEQVTAERAFRAANGMSRLEAAKRQLEEQA